MKTRKLGNAQVSAIGLGTMSFGGIFGPTDQAESLACLDAMLDAGITFIDTANIYGMGVKLTQHCKKILGCFSYISAWRQNALYTFINSRMIIFECQNANLQLC